MVWQVCVWAGGIFRRYPDHPCFYPWPFSVNQAAVRGIAAVKDTEFPEKSVAIIKNGCLCYPLLTQLGLGVLPSQTNFILIHFDPEKGVSAGEAEAFFASVIFITVYGRLRADRLFAYVCWHR